MQGYAVVYRIRETSEIIIDAVEELPFEHRIIFCQAISDIEQVKKGITLITPSDETDDIADKIAGLVSDTAWLATQYPLRSFTAVTGGIKR